MMLAPPAPPSRSKPQGPVGADARPEIAPETAFARHETFAPRYGWLKKGYDAVEKDGAVFNQENAALVLGVGKNMARAIRYWALAFGVVEPVPSAFRRPSGALQPSPFGKRLLGARGWDPFLEDLGSLWLLHWSLLREFGTATSWRHAFFEFGLTEFSVDELASSLATMVHRRFPTARAAPSSLRKDASCIIQMYAGGTLRRVETEESIRSPFVQLDLMGRGIAARSVAFRSGEKPGLSPDLVVAVCLDYMKRRGSERSISFNSLLRGEGSPGLALRLSEGSLYAALEHATRQRGELHLSDSAGIIQLAVSVSTKELRTAMLKEHYEDTSVRRRSQ